MRIEHKVPVVISCASMHEHWWDTMYLGYDDTAPLEFTLTLRDRVDGNSSPLQDITWTLPRSDFADTLTYSVPGVNHAVGCASLRIRLSKPNILVVRVPFYDERDGSTTQQYLMFKTSKLRVFLADVDRVVPQSCEEQALDVDRLIGRLLYG